MWSFGCILAELFKGYPLFPGESEGEQIQIIASVRGLPPANVLAVSPRRSNFFHSNGEIRITEHSNKRKWTPNMRSLGDAVHVQEGPFLDLITRCLEWDPEKRITPEQALKHEWITDKELKAREPSVESSKRRGTVRRSIIRKPLAK